MSDLRLGADFSERSDVNSDLPFLERTLGTLLLRSGTHLQRLAIGWLLVQFGP